jgi:acyl dehydratase
VTALEPGRKVELGRVEGLTRTQIARYAGASGDSLPLHTDEPYAQAAGHPSVIAHGMYTMGVAGRLVAEALGHEHLRRFGGRFTAVVLPGDDLVVTAEATEDGVTVVVTNQDGREVFVGYAEAPRT